MESGHDVMAGRCVFYCAYHITTGHNDNGIQAIVLSSTINNFFDTAKVLQRVSYYTIYLFLLPTAVIAVMTYNIS